MTPALVRPSRSLLELSVPEMWARGLSGRGVRVALVDSGIDPDCAPLRDRIRSFATVSACGRHVDPALFPRDHTGHGTHVAGLVVGGQLDGQSIGVAPQASIVPVAVLDEGDVIARVAHALGWLAEQPVDIVVLPLGIAGDNSILWPAIAALLDRNVIIVAADGNDTPRPAPASYPGVLVAAGEGRTSRVSGQDVRQDPSALAIGIPSTHVLSYGIGSTRQTTMSGASQAAGHLAGLCALWRQAHPGLSSMSVAQILARTHDTKPTRASERLAPHLLEQIRDRAPRDRASTYYPAAKFRDPTLVRHLAHRDVDVLRWLMVDHDIAPDEQRTRLQRAGAHEALRLATNTWLVTGPLRVLEGLWYDDDVAAISCTRPPTPRLRLGNNGMI